MSEQLQKLMEDISARMESLGENVSDERIRGLVQDQFKALATDDAFVRKMRFGSDVEPKVVGTKYARWGLSIGDIEFLYDLQESLKGQRKVNGGGVYEGASEYLRNTFGAISDAMYLSEAEVREMDKQAIDNLFPRIPLRWFHGPDRNLAKRGAWELTDSYQRAIRAMDSAESGYGSQLIGAQYVGDLWEAARRESMILSLLESFEMQAPTAYLPVEVDFPEMLFVAESTANNSANYTTSKTGSNRVQVDAKKFVIHQMWSGEMEEDSIIPFIPFLRKQAQKALAFYGDSLVLNGDTTNAGTGNINLDDADPADTKHYLALDGIRHTGLVDNTGNSLSVAGAITFNKLIEARGRMVDHTYKVDWGHPNDPNDLVYVSDVDTADRIALLDEVITVDKMGSQATVLNGQQARIGRHPLVGSMAMSKTEADGKVSTTGSNNTLGQIATFNRRAFTVGWRRRIKLETERLPASDQSRLVYSMRMGLGRFSPTGAASGIEGADVMYNISL